MNNTPTTCEFYRMHNTGIFPFNNIYPKLGDHVFLAAGSQIIGDLEIAHHTSIWFNVVIRADINTIRIGHSTNIQDNSVVHVTSGTGPTVIGNYVTIGHNAIIHACTIEDFVLIGMGSIILDGAVIPQNSLVAAGSVVPPGKQYFPGSLIMGSPAKAVRPLKENEIRGLKSSAVQYIESAKSYFTLCV